MSSCQVFPEVERYAGSAECSSKDQAESFAQELSKLQHLLAQGIRKAASHAAAYQTAQESHDKLREALGRWDYQT